MDTNISELINFYLKRIDRSVDTLIEINTGNRGTNKETTVLEADVIRTMVKDIRKVINR